MRGEKTPTCHPKQRVGEGGDVKDRWRGCLAKERKQKRLAWLWHKVRMTTAQLPLRHLNRRPREVDNTSVSRDTFAGDLAKILGPPTKQ